MWGICISFNALQALVLESQAEYKKKYTPADFSHFQTVEVEEGEFIIIESEPEFEVELDWFSIPIKSFNIIKPSLKEYSNSHTNTLFSSKETIPLYDLYCNWKFHLS
jgi:NADPH-dependent 7-cyano-7-deazaguanine reductase QueF-like protein